MTAPVKVPVSPRSLTKTTKAAFEYGHRVQKMICSEVAKSRHEEKQPPRREPPPKG